MYPEHHAYGGNRHTVYLTTNHVFRPDSEQSAVGSWLERTKDRSRSFEWVNLVRKF